jgi:hypothetical protein
MLVIRKLFEQWFQNATWMLPQELFPKESKCENIAKLTISKRPTKYGSYG